MIETWRWFGPDDPVKLRHIIQAGATGVVTALHDVPTGDVWSLDAILERQKVIADVGLEWTVVESIPVHSDIKTRSGNWRTYVDNYKQSLRNVGQAGIRVVCYNFMAVIDWTRTTLDLELPSTAKALGFDMADMAAYDIFLLQREDAASDYSNEVVARAESRIATMSDAQKTTLETNILAGLPGGDGTYDRNSFREALKQFSALDDEAMRGTFFAFLEEVLPIAEESGVHMSVHPDDPPFALFGLPRVMSTADDARKLLTALPSEHNGLTFCAGSFGSRSDNDLVEMAREFARHISFVHLRNVRRQDDGSFYESEHLSGDNDMLGLIQQILEEEFRRKEQGNGLPQIPMRPDHGHLMGDEMSDANSRPGYSYAGRMKGLAELRGVIFAVDQLRQRELKSINPNNA